MGMITTIELIVFSLLLIWIFGKILISVFKNKAKDNKAALESSGLFNFKLSNKIPYSIAIAVAALVSLDIVTRVVAISMWNWLYHGTEGTFFWGLQIVIFLSIFIISMNKDEKSKPINPKFLWAIVLIFFVGLANQPKIKEYFSMDNISRITNVGTDKPSMQNVQKGGRWITLSPDKWYTVNVSSIYSHMSIRSRSEIVIERPNGTTYVDRPDLGNKERGSYGIYRFKPNGENTVKMWLSLT